MGDRRPTARHTYTGPAGAYTVIHIHWAKVFTVGQDLHWVTVRGHLTLEIDLKQNIFYFQLAVALGR